MSPSARRFLYSALLLGVTAVWGWTFVVIKSAVAHFGVLGFLALRFTVAVAVLAPFTAQRADRRAWAVGAPIGGLLVVAYLCQTYGLRYTSATNSGLITGLFIAFAPLCNRLLYGVRTPLLCWLAVVLSLAGLVLLTGHGWSLPNLGDVLTLGCALAFGFYVALLDRHAPRHDSGGLALTQMVATAAGFLILWPLGEPLALPPPQVWGAILITGVLCSAVGFYAQTAGQRELPAIRAAMILTMEPVFAVFFGWLLAGDRLGAAQLAGGALMVGALVVTNLTPAHPRTELVA
jgi:drug/metabolite transporter (DMT)-like permease